MHIHGLEKNGTDGPIYRAGIKMQTVGEGEGEMN